MNQYYPVIISSFCVSAVLLITVAVMAIKMYRKYKKDKKQYEVRHILHSVGFNVDDLQLN